MNYPLIVYGGNFDPPGVWHEKIAKILSQRAPVLVYPSGARKDKEGNIDPRDRAKLCKLAFGGMENVMLNVENIFEENLPHFRLHERVKKLYPDCTPVFFIGADLLPDIKTKWQQGEEIWQDLYFLVGKRPGYQVVELPPHSEVLEISEEGSSTEVREILAKGDMPIGKLSPDVLTFIREYKLYRRK